MHVYANWMIIVCRTTETFCVGTSFNLHWVNQLNISRLFVHWCKIKMLFYAQWIRETEEIQITFYILPACYIVFENISHYKTVYEMLVFVLTLTFSTVKWKYWIIGWRYRFLSQLVKFQQLWFFFCHAILIISNKIFQFIKQTHKC